jgi:hypothetical protein
MEHLTKYEINITYKCTLTCEYCIMGIDLVPWPNTDITPEEIELGARSLQENGVKVQRIRVTGGDPPAHPRFAEVYKAIQKYWDGTDGMVVCTNGVLTLPEGLGVKWVVSSPTHYRKPTHKATMISPIDVGLEPHFGVKRLCKMAKRCGAGFDAFGFGFCPEAGAMGRFLGVDPYKTKPQVLGIEEICHHCPYSLHETDRIELSDLAKSGKMEYPTKTWREGIERLRDEHVVFKHFAQRVKEEQAIWWSKERDNQDRR